VLDDLYLQRSIEIILADRGAQIARSAESAEYLLKCLVGAIGLDISGRFVGVQGTKGGILLPFRFPDIALYQNTVRRGVAKTAIYLVDLETNEVVHHSGPVEGTTYRQSKTYLFFFGSADGDTTRLE
jgi:hypothetical protein